MIDPFEVGLGQRFEFTEPGKTDEEFGSLIIISRKVWNTFDKPIVWLIVRELQVMPTHIEHAHRLKGESRP